MKVLVYASPVRAFRARQGVGTLEISTCVCMCYQIHASHGKELRYAHASTFPWPRLCLEARYRCQLLMDATSCCGFRREPRTVGRSDYEERVCLPWDSQRSVVTFMLK